MELLNKDPSLVPATLRLLESGAVQKMASRCTGREIPENANRIYFPSKKFIAQVVTEMSGGSVAPDMIKRWSERQENVVMHLFLFAPGGKRESPVSPTPMLEAQYLLRLRLRAHALGDRPRCL